MKSPAKVRLHVALSPGAAARLRTLAAAEGTDVSGMVEFLVRSSNRKVVVFRAAALPPVPLEPEEEPDPFPGEETIGGILTGKAQWIPVPPPELRDPLAEGAPAWVRRFAEAVRDGDPGVIASDRAALKAWMLGDPETDLRRGDPITSLTEIQEGPQVLEGRVPLVLGDEVPGFSHLPEVPPEPFRLPVVIVEDQIPAMQRALQRVVDEAIAPRPDRHVEPNPVVPAAPPKPLRDYSAPDAPEWVRRIVGALADGLDALVPEEAMESLRAWRRGEDVGEPDLSGLAEEE